MDDRDHDDFWVRDTTRGKSMIVTLLVTTIKLTRSKIKTIVSAFIPAALWDPNIVSEEEIINHVP